MLLLSFGVALVLNTALLLQIIYYGMVSEGLSLLDVFAADLGHAASNNDSDNKKLDSSNLRSSDKYAAGTKKDLELLQTLPLFWRSSSNMSRDSSGDSSS